MSQVDEIKKEDWKTQIDWFEKLTDEQKKIINGILNEAFDRAYLEWFPPIKVNDK